MALGAILFRRFARIADVSSRALETLHGMSGAVRSGPGELSASGNGRAAQSQRRAQCGNRASRAPCKGSLEQSRNMSTDVTRVMSPGGSPAPALMPQTGNAGTERARSVRRRWTLADEFRRHDERADAHDRVGSEAEVSAVDERSQCEPVQRYFDRTGMHLFFRAFR